MACRDCRFLDVGLNKAGRRVPHPARAYRCTFDIPVPAKLPKSVVSVYSAGKRYMEPRDGDGCECHEPLRGIAKTAAV